MVEPMNRRATSAATDTTAGLTRRHLLKCLAFSASLATTRFSVAAPAKRTGLLAQPKGIRELNTRNKIVLELTGNLHIEEPDQEKDERVRKAEVKAKSTLEYFEKSAFEDSAVAAAGRRYTEASVENWISGSASSFQLRPECQETRMLHHEGMWQQYCEKEPLSVREVELLQSPINSSAVERLLPKEPAKPDAEWKLSAEDAAALFNLEAVHNSTVQARISKVEKGKATVEVSGDLHATANSVPTTLTINGNFQVSLGRQCALVTWLSLVIKEEREISQAEPGFAITARVRLIRAETGSEISATRDQLLALAKNEDDTRWLVRLKSRHGNFSLLADRKWKMFIDGGEESILRMIDKNTIMAQCNVVRLTELKEGSQLTIEGLNAEIKKSLGDDFESFLESSEKAVSPELRLMRTVATGQSEGVPIHWIYAHLSDDLGRRTAMVYTMGANVAEKFAATDEQMTSSFQMLAEPSKTDDQPTPAPQLSAKPDAKKR